MVTLPSGCERATECEVELLDPFKKADMPGGLQFRYDGNASPYIATRPPAASTTPAELFHRIAVTLHGEHYIAPLAHDLGCGKETVRKMAAGKSPIGAGMWDRIEALVVRRREALRQAEVELGAFRAELAVAAQAERSKQ